MSQVVLEDVCKSFTGRLNAVDHVNLQVGDGEFLVLVGPSGCGKSTTLRLIAGLEEVSSGRIRIGDRIVNDVHPKDRDIAMVFQNYALYPHMTVYRNMAFALMLRKVPKAEIDARVRLAANTLGITDLLDRKPRSLSGGQRQRVALGRALVREPACFLFDEPLSNLDARLRIQMRAELKSLHLRLKRTAIYVTHDQEEAMTLGDRIAVMSAGRIQQCASPLEVYRKPVNRFVAGFVGMPPMNFVEGRIERVDGELTFTDGVGVRFTLPSPWASSVLHMLNRAVTLGLRPEALRPAVETATPVAPRISVTVRVVEPLGDRVDLVGSTEAGASIVARTDAGTPSASGDRVHLEVRPDGMHLFEPGEAGRNLMYGI